MIEATLIQYLNNALSCNVYAEAPEEHDSEYVLVQKTGSSSENKLQTATIAIQSISTTKYKAAQLNDTVKTKMAQMPASINRVSAAVCTTDYDFSNPDTRERRYQAVYDIIYIEE